MREYLPNQPQDIKSYEEIYRLMRNSSSESPFLTHQAVLDGFFNNPIIITCSPAIIRHMEKVGDKIALYNDNALPQLCLGARTYNLLMRRGIDCLSDVVYRYHELEDVYGIGQVSHSRIGSELKLLFPHLFS